MGSQVDSAQLLHPWSCGFVSMLHSKPKKKKNRKVWDLLYTKIIIVDNAHAPHAGLIEWKRILGMVGLVVW